MYLLIFRKHSAQNHLFSNTLAHHDHQKFEVYAFAELSKEDHVTKQYQSYVDHWIPTQNLTDQQMAQKIRDMEIDILVDLAGHTMKIIVWYLLENQLLFL